MTKIRAKFYCYYVQPNRDGSNTVHMNAVYGGGNAEHESTKFSDATPHAVFSMTIKEGGPEFEQGQEYYLDFIKATPAA